MTSEKPIKRGPGRPPRITRAQILAEVRKFPANSLTMPALAKVLKVETPALYHHFRSREDLVLAYGREAFAEMQIPAPDPDNWREWFLQINMNLYRFMLKHPLLMEIGPSAEGFLAVTLNLCEAVLETLQAAGFDRDESYWIMISMTQVSYSAARNEREGQTPLTVYSQMHEDVQRRRASIPRTAEFIDAIQQQTNEAWLEQMLRWCIGCIPEPSD